MIKHYLLFSFLLFFSFAVKSENYPYRSDVLWVTVPNHSNWLYDINEKAEVEIEFYKYGIPQNNLKVDYEIGNDLMPADKKGSIILKNGKGTIDMGTSNKPCFRDCKLFTSINGKAYTHHVKIGFSPERLKPYTKFPSDFVSFWEKAKYESSQFPLKFTKTRIERYSTDKFVCDLVKIQINKAGQSIYGYLFTPIKPGKYPVVLCPPGAGVKTIKDPLRHRYYAENGFIRFEIEIHGLNPEMSDEKFKEISLALNSGENSYLKNGLQSKDTYYMKRVYLACVKAVDFLSSLDEWDGKNIILQGGSQGGALSIVTAALDNRVTACVANHPAFSDMAGFMANRADGYPHFSKSDVRNITPQIIETLSYYDVANFAKLVKCPTFMTWGFNDNTCPPTTSYITYNSLKCVKECLITPINEHWTSEDTEYGHMVWILKHLQ